MSGINYQPSDKEILQTHIHNTDEKYKVGLDKGQQTVFFLLLFLHHSAKVFKMSLFSTKNPVTDSPVICRYPYHLVLVFLLFIHVIMGGGSD